MHIKLHRDLWHAQHLHRVKSDKILEWGRWGIKDVLVRVSVAMINHHDQRHLEDKRVYFSHVHH